MPKSNTLSICQRRPVARATKEDVWCITYGWCWYCGCRLNPFENFVVEHVIPLCRGGADALENLVPACDWCNRSKGTRLVEEWRLTDECRANVLDTPWDGRFWFELSAEEVSKYKSRWRDTQTPVELRAHVLSYALVRWEQ
jgi:hypothetical protein